MTVVFDIETLSNCFTYTDIDINTNEVKQFVVHKDRNDFNEFCDHLFKIRGQIGFNNLSFDAQVIQYIINNRENWLLNDSNEIAVEIYNYAQQTIEKMNNGSWGDYPEWKMTIPQCDLFKIWHFDNKAKMTSLKWIEYMIDMDSIEEMPIHHSQNIKLEQISSILAYNLNDVMATLELYNITIGKTNLPLYKGVDKIQLRKDIIRDMGIKCLNYNDVKIGDAINKMSYCNFSGNDIKQLPRANKEIKSFKFKDCFPSYMRFDTLEFNNFINAIANIDVNLKKETDKSKKQSYEFYYNDTTYVMAKGGLHSKDSPRCIKPLENEILRDCDVGSMYPNALVKRQLYPKHLGKEWLMGYSSIIEKRIKAKKDGKKAINEAYKLALNGGGFGKLNEEYNWQYDPYIAFCVTIGSQIDLLMLIEDLETNGIHVVSANTDGLVCLFDKSLETKYYEVCTNWEKEVGNDTTGKLEYADYKLLYQTSVNDYLAIKYDNSIKTKGDFSTEFELHKNKSARIVPIALNEYIVKGIPVRTTIENHQNIFDFCLGVKSIGKNRLLTFDKKEQIEVELPKINRYYISNEGVHILKKLPKLDKKTPCFQYDLFGGIDDGTRQQEIEAGWVSTLYNKHTHFVNMEQYNINYKYYIQKCEKIINQIS